MKSQMAYDPSLPLARTAKFKMTEFIIENPKKPKLVLPQI